MNSDLTPLMRQYQDVKRQYQDAILFFRVGDFYEMFFEDAEEASHILEIILTSRGKVKDVSIPLCGIPYHAATGYIAKLLKAGKTVALCEQMEDAQFAKGLVRREVVRLYTPGTLIDNELLPGNESNFLASLSTSQDHQASPPADFGLAVMELSTGEFWMMESCSGPHNRHLLDEISRLDPKELVLSKELHPPLVTSLEGLHIPRLAPQPDSWFTVDRASTTLATHFGPDFLREMPQNHITLAVQATGALLQYLHATQPTMNHRHLQPPHIRQPHQEMYVDSLTVRNLELLKPLSDNKGSPTLFSILDRTVTSMGSRLLRQWISRPLLDLHHIQARQKAVAELVNQVPARFAIRQALKSIKDIERLNSRISMGAAHPRDLLALKQSLAGLPSLHPHLACLQATMFEQMAKRWDHLQDVHGLIDQSISPEAGGSSRDGGCIKNGYHRELDELRSLARDGTKWMAELEAKERTRTGIDSLKIKFNHVFGYFIEVTKANASRTPADYLRKQTLANAERFTIPELTQLENQIRGAEQKIQSLETTLFQHVRSEIAQASPRIKSMAVRLGTLDVLAGLAETATTNRYVQPDIHTGGSIFIQEGRHPVIEQFCTAEGFIPNDTYLDLDSNRLLLITGPNMAGKSTYIRQVALLVLMAQMGSFVPAHSARIGIVDRIFTRIGASDNLSGGQSTFMMEMVETAEILESATNKSLILLDEVGRGTSTYDGLSIAWSIAEYILDRLKIGARTLFATHYHEMTQLEDLHEGMKNYTVAVKEQDQNILFLRKIVEGKADRSYGIHVARLAGLPDPVILRAQDVLRQLEASSETQSQSVLPSDPHHPSQQIDHSIPLSHPIIEEVEQMDLFSITPIEALNRLADFQRRLKPR